MGKTVTMWAIGMSVICLAGPSRAAAEQQDRAKPATVKETTSAEENVAVEKVASDSVPRKARRERREVHYLQANVRHAPQYYRSPQEKLQHDDARGRGLVGAVAAGMFELIHFPARLALTPVLLVTRPLWVPESARP